MSFAAAIKRFNNNAMAACTAVLRESVTGVTEALVENTPFVTGKARSSYFWGASANVAPLDSGSISPDGSPSLQRAREFASTIQAGGIIHVVTFVSYAAELEYGTATRNASAMFRKTEAAWPEIGRAAEKRAMAKAGK